MGWVSVVLEVLKAIPTIVDLWRKWEIAKLKRQQDEEAQRRKDAIDAAIKAHDQTEIEKIIGSSTPGGPAKDQTGVEVRPSKVRP